MKLTSESELVSYSLGLNIGASLTSQGFENLDTQIIAHALEDVFKGNATLVDPNDANKILNEYFQKAQERKHAKNIEEGTTFLNANKLKEGVITLPSGLQYLVMKEGNGPKPSAQDQVTTHYHGTLIDGRVFDSSVDRGQPATFPVNGVIQGWVEALQLMPLGSKWKLFVPSSLAYGARGAGELIGPHTTLVFEVELLKIN
jgi:FKBP-type peptidyl-prolyl cis-trans isomerase FklB